MKLLYFINDNIIQKHFICFVIMQLFSVVILANDTPLKSTNKFDEFFTLSPQEQKLTLKKSFETRLKHMQNIYYCMEVCYYDGKSGNESAVPFKTQYRHWQLKKAYRIDVEQIRLSDQTSTHWSRAIFDPEAGEIRSTFKSDKTSDRVFERIDTSIDPLVWSNRYRCWLNKDILLGDVLDDNSFIFSHALSQEDNWDIAPFENKTIRLVLNYKNQSVVNCSGKRTLILYTDKDFLPINGHSRWDGFMASGDEWWWEENFNVEKNAEINGIWMPMQISESIERSDNPNFLAVDKIIVSEIEIGNVTESDVFLPFYEGTEVTDAIKGVSYKTDANGEPIESTIEPLHGLDPSQVKLPEPPINIVFIVAGILLIVTALYLQFRKRRNKN
jgi:hypothetical protein